MFLVTFTGILFIAAFIALGFGKSYVPDKSRKDTADTRNGSVKVVFRLRSQQLLSLFTLLLLLMGTVKFIPVNSVGIKFNQFSGVSEEVLSEGMKFKSPFDTVYIIPTEVRSKMVEDVAGQTKDAQWINITLDIKYRVSEANAFKVFKQFKTLDKVDETLLTPLVQRSIEEVTTKYNVIDILGEKRNQVYTEIELVVKTKLAESGIEFFSLVLMDTDAGASIEEAIEREAVAKKEVETAQQTQEKARIEAETKVFEAESAAKVKLIEAQAASDANLLISNSITPEILKKMEMEARLKFGWVEITGAQLIIGQ